MRTPTIALLVLFAVPAAAETGPWTPAPVPSVSPVEHVQPAARAGLSTGSAVDAPFSAVSPDSVSAGGATSSNTTNDVQTPSLSPQ